MRELRKNLTDSQLKAIETAKAMQFVFDSLYKIKPPKKQEEVNVGPLMVDDVISKGGFNV